MHPLLTTRGTCLYCPIHEVSWLAQPWNEPAHWHPVPRGMLALALGLARAGGVGHLITVEVVACDRCEAERKYVS